MKKIAYIITALALASCVTEPIYNTAHPTQGTVIVNIDMTGLPDGFSPSGFTIYQGGEEHNYDPSNSTFIIDPAASEEFLAYNKPQGITITDGVATLGEATRVAQDPEPQPKDLHYGYTTMQIEADKVHEVSITPKRGNAMLTLKLDYVESEVANIQDITATLSGVAATRNLRTDAISDEVTLIHYPDFDAASPLVLEFNIFGTLGTEQILTLTYTTTDGQTRVVSSNLSSQLANFNANMEALTLTGDMNLPSDLEAEGSISDWNVVDNGDVNIN